MVKKINDKDLEEILFKEDDTSLIDKAMMIDMCVMSTVMMLVMFAITIIEYSMIFIIILLTGVSIFAYIKNLKRMDTVLGKMFLDSTVYLDDVSWNEKVSIDSYQMVEREVIGVDDPKMHVSLVYESNGSKSYYVSETPLSKQSYSVISIPTIWGVAEGLGTMISARLLDIIIDPNTGEKIPVKQIIMSSSIALKDKIELIPLTIEPAVITPVVESSVDDTLGVKKTELKTWTLMCNKCGASLDISSTEESELGVYIECEYCGTQNGIRSVRSD